jgi:hypothetical protein
MVYLDTLSYLPPPRASLFVAVTTLFYQLILVRLLPPHVVHPTNISSRRVIVVPLATPVATNISSPAPLRVTPPPLSLALPPAPWTTMIATPHLWWGGHKKTALRRLVG